MSVTTLLNTIKAEGKIKNDARLAKVLDVAPSHICKLRSGHTALTGDTVLRIYDEVGMSIERIRALAAA